MHVQHRPGRRHGLVGHRLSTAAGLLLPGVTGLALGLLAPRGPSTTVTGLVALIACLITGLAVGWVLRSRWSLVVAPLTFAAAYEVARLRVDGPISEVPRFGDIYGVMALLVGRGVDAVLMVMPLLVGIGYGLVVAHRHSLTPGRPPGPHRVWLGRLGLTLGTLAVLALIAGLVRPASTEGITYAGGPLPGSIAELVDIRVGGHEQAVMLRGRSVASPVLLFLEGGPGGTALGRVRNAGEDLEDEFVVATWDQRGTGKSYDALEPTDTLTVESMVDDTLQVVQYLRRRFDEDKVFLVGSSWGTIIGTLAAQRAPQLFHAYVGTGQMVDPFRTDQLMYAESVADAVERGNQEAVRELEEIGPPPYEDTLDYPLAIASNPKWVDFPHGDDYNPASEYPMSLFVAEYTLIEQLRGMGAVAETFSVLYPQLADVDLRTDVRALDLPVYVVEGRYEAAGRETLARAWFDRLDAPHREYVRFHRSGHTPPYDEPGRFADLMERIALASTTAPR
jgi:proline iminopeptidase